MNPHIMVNTALQVLQSLQTNSGRQIQTELSSTTLAGLQQCIGPGKACVGLRPVTGIPKNR
uniref:Uncharacterized protein n=1 Tax=Arundo donax TaxID=35708 RepID=A0A0A9ADE5_ARUDO